MAMLSEARKSHGSHSAGLDQTDAVSAECAITLEGVSRKLVEGGKPTGSVCDQTGKLPNQKQHVG